LEIFEDDTLVANLSDTAILRAFLITLNSISIGSHRFIDLWKRVTDGNSLLSETYEKWGDRSNWSCLWPQAKDLWEAQVYRPGIMSERLAELTKIDQREFDDVESKFAKSIKIKGKQYQKRTFFLYTIVECFLRPNYALMADLEGVVDQLFDTLRAYRMFSG